MLLSSVHKRPLFSSRKKIFCLVYFVSHRSRYNLEFLAEEGKNTTKLPDTD